MVPGWWSDITAVVRAGPGYQVCGWRHDSWKGASLIDEREREGGLQQHCTRLRRVPSYCCSGGRPGMSRRADVERDLGRDKGAADAAGGFKAGHDRQSMGSRLASVCSGQTVTLRGRSVGLAEGDCSDRHARDSVKNGNVGVSTVRLCSNDSGGAARLSGDNDEDHDQRRPRLTWPLQYMWSLLG